MIAKLQSSPNLCVKTFRYHCEAVFATTITGFVRFQSPGLRVEGNTAEWKKNFEPIRALRKLFFHGL